MTKVLRLILITALITGMIGPATALDSSYDNNCKKLEDTEELRAAEETANMSPLLLIGFKFKQKTCKGVEFIRNVFTKEPDPDKIDADLVFEASKPQMDPVKVRQEYLKEERKAEQRMKDREERLRDEYLRSNPANDAARERNERADEEGMQARVREPLVPFPIPAPEAVILPPKKVGGFIQIFQGKVTPVDAKGTMPQSEEQLNGEGTFIGEDGLESGTFEGGELEGGGQEITPDGVWRGGEYRDGEIEGPGFEVGTRDGQVYYMDANFVDDRPDGTVTMSYTDGTSQRVLWKDGEPVAYGQMAALGAIPAEPVYKSPQQLAAEADAAFEASLAAVPSAGALYAMADELEEQGDNAKARRAYRALMTRFPTSPLADRAAGQLDSNDASFGASEFSDAGGRQSNGDPTPKFSSICMRNTTKLEKFLQSLPGQTYKESSRTYSLMARVFEPCRGYDPQAADFYVGNTKLAQSADAKGIGSSYEDGNNLKINAEIAKALADPNYSAEYGSVGSANSVASNKPAGTTGLCPATGSGFAAFDKAVADFGARYPVSPAGGTRDTYQWKIFFGTETLKILEKFRTCISAGQYADNRALLQGQLDDGKTNCPKFSTDGGANCVAEYPRNWQ